MLVLTIAAYLGYYLVLAWTYCALALRRVDSAQPASPPSADPTDPTASAGGGSWSWLGALFSPLGDSTIAVLDRTPPLSFAARPASFGRRISEEDGAVVGYLIPIDAFALSPSDGNACAGTLVRDGHRIPEVSESWIALVQRGGCGFAAKVLTAQQFGARAVVVGNSEPRLETGERDSLVQMYAPGSSGVEVTIPSAFVTFATFNRLQRLLEKSNTTTSGYRTLSLAMLPEIGGWEWYSPVLTFLALLLLPSLLTLITLLLHRVRVARARRADRAPEEVVFALPWRVWGERGLLGDGDEDHDDKLSTSGLPPLGSALGGLSIVGSVDVGQGNPTPSNGADGSDVPASPSSAAASPAVPTERTTLCPPNTTHASTSRLDFMRVGPPPVWFASQTQCAICLGDFERGDRVRILPCRHVFHLEEVDAWLISRKKVCPICKSDVTAHLRALAAARESRVARLLGAFSTLFPHGNRGVQPAARVAQHQPDIETGYGAVGTTDQGSPDSEDRWLSISERLARREAQQDGIRIGGTYASSETEFQHQQRARDTAIEDWVHGEDDSASSSHSPTNGTHIDQRAESEPQHNSPHRVAS